MPTTKSATRRVKKTKLQTSVNRVRKNKYKSAIKQMSIYIVSGNKKKAEDFLPKFHSLLMKIAKTGAIRRETVSRKISRITKKIRTLKK